MKLYNYPKWDLDFEDQVCHYQIPDYNIKHFIIINQLIELMVLLLLFMNQFKLKIIVQMAHIIVLELNYIKLFLVLVKWYNVIDSTGVNEAVGEFHKILSVGLNVNINFKNTNPKLVKANLKVHGLMNIYYFGLKKKLNLSKEVQKRLYEKILVNFYNKFEVDISNTIATTKKTYYSNLFNKNKGNISEQWKIINNLTDKKNNTQLVKLKIKNCNIVDSS